MSEQVKALVAEVQGHLETLSADPGRDEALYDDLRARLNDVPSEERTSAWRRTSVLLDLAFRKRAKRAHAQLSIIRENHRKADTLDRFDAFWARCVALLDGWTLGGHGYRRALRDQGPAVWADVAELTALLDAAGHRAFANSGTLLGLVREGDVIADDDDADLGVLLPGDTLAEVVAAWADLRARLAADGVTDADFEQRNALHSKVIGARGTRIDLFPAWVLEDRAWVWPHTAGDVPAAALLPLVSRETSAGTVPVPAEPEPFLESNYGAAWRRPDPTWEFDWARARTRFPDFVAAHPEFAEDVTE